MTAELDCSDPSVARAVRRQIPGAVAVLTTVFGPSYRGATVTAYAVASIEPFQVLVSLDGESQIVGWVSSYGSFAISTLPWPEQFLADQFSGFAPLASGSFQGIPHVIAETGAPILARCITWVDCTVESSFPTGDHIVLVGRVVACGRGSGEQSDPLIYAANRYARLS